MSKLRNTLKEIYEWLPLVLLSPVIIIMLPLFLLIACAPLGACNHCGEFLEIDENSDKSK